MDRLYKAITKIQNEYDLTENESDILTCLSKGMTIEEMKDQIFLKTNTINTIRSRLIRKLVPEQKQGVNSNLKALSLVIDELIK